MNVYVGDGDVVKMECKETGDRKNPNMHEWVLKSDVDKENESSITFEFKPLCDAYPQYGQPVLLKSNGVIQHVTFMLNGSDDCEDWFEPFHFDHFDHEDDFIISLGDVEALAPMPNWYE